MAQFYDQSAVTTLQGCKCKSACGTSVAFNCDAGEYCRTRDGCGRTDSVGGSYDYCAYPAYKPYESKTAAEKHELLWSKLTEDRTAGTYPSKLSVLTGLMGESVKTSFDAKADVFPIPGRTREIHSVGIVAPISFIPMGSDYTGIFKGGAKHGFIRASSAAAPSTSSGWTPGVGVKFLRDGERSVNFVAMPSLDGQKCSGNDKNFFEKSFQNHIAATSNFALKLIQKKFWQASSCPLMVGLSDFAKMDAHGKAAEGDVKFPWELVMRPPAGLVAEVDCDHYPSSLHNSLQALTPNTTIFNVFAKSDPEAGETQIGSFVLTDKFTTSKFGDAEIFFKHQYMEDDFALQPDWLAAANKQKLCGMDCAGKIPTVDGGCHSPFSKAQTPAFLADTQELVV